MPGKFVSIMTLGPSGESTIATYAVPLDVWDDVAALVEARGHFEASALITPGQAANMSTLAEQVGYARFEG